MASMEINQTLQVLIDLVHPGLPPRQQAATIRNDLIQLYRERAKTLVNGTMAPEPLIPFETVPADKPRDIADRIASWASHIDDGNWALLKNGIQGGMDAGWWDTARDEPRILVELHKPFVNAVNEFRVQHSRIKAFFERHSGE